MSKKIKRATKIYAYILISSFLGLSSAMINFFSKEGKETIAYADVPVAPTFDSPDSCPDSDPSDCCN